MREVILSIGFSSLVVTAMLLFVILVLFSGVTKARKNPPPVNIPTQTEPKVIKPVMKVVVNPPRGMSEAELFFYTIKPNIQFWIDYFLSCYGKTIEEAYNSDARFFYVEEAMNRDEKA